MTTGVVVADDVDAVLHALENDDPTAVRGRLRRRLRAHDPEHLDALIRFAHSVWWSSNRIEDEAFDLEGTVKSVVHDSLTSDWATLLLATYLHAVCSAAWEMTWEHTQINQLIAFSRGAWQAAQDEVRDAPWFAETDLAFRLLELLGLELRVETAAATGVLALHRREALAAACHARGIAREASRLSSPIARILEDKSTVELNYYSRVAMACAAVSRFLGCQGGDLEGAIRALETLEADESVHDVDASELRAHRYALQALAHPPHRDWLRVDSGSIVCLFPFGLHDLTPEETVALVRRGGAEWSLAGLKVQDGPTPFLMVDDIWHGDDALYGGYDGTQLVLPDLEFFGEEALPSVGMTVEVRFSTLGNHCLRVEIPLDNVLPNDLFQLVWIPAPEFGNLVDLGCGIRGVDHDRAWGRLADLATDVIKDIGVRLAGSGTGTVHVSTRPGMYHVITRIAKASLLPHGDLAQAGDITEPERILDLLGAETLQHPIPPGIGSIAQWALYDRSAAKPLSAPSLHRDMIVSNVNLTLLCCFGSPNFMIDYTQEALEFAFSLEGMFAGWQDRLARHYEWIKPRLDELEAQLANNGSFGSLRRRGEPSFQNEIDELEQEQIAQRRFLTSSEVTMMLIASPSLVTSPLMRATLDAFLEAAGVWKRHDAFIRVADGVLENRLEELVTSRVRRHEEQQQARIRRTIEVLLFFIAAIGISGLLSMIQSGWDIERHGTTLLVGIVVTLALVLSYAVYWWGSPKSRQR